MTEVERELLDGAARSASTGEQRLLAKLRGAGDKAPGRQGRKPRAVTPPDLEVEIHLSIRRSWVRAPRRHQKWLTADGPQPTWTVIVPFIVEDPLPLGSDGVYGPPPDTSRVTVSWRSGTVTEKSCGRAANTGGHPGSVDSIDG